MEIIRGIHAVPGTHISRVYLIEGDDLTLIDTGLPWSAGRVLRYIRRIGRHASELRRILMTHSHPDHAGGAHGILKRSGARVIAHRADTREHRRYDAHVLAYLGMFPQIDTYLPLLKYTPVNHLPEEDEILPIVGGIRVLHTPGHTPGSVCYFLERDGLLFSGDTIFSEQGQVSRSMPFPGSDAERYRQSLERLAALDFDILCGGHGTPLVGGASREFRSLMNRKPQLPTWREFFFKRVPSRLLHYRGLSAEDY